MSRLLFFIEDKVVGYFVGDSYPSHPGRYRYEPSRGEGHAILSKTLKTGTPMRCHFVNAGSDVSIIVIQEIFVPAAEESYWFLDVYSLESAAGLLSAKQHPYTHALMPFTLCAAQLPEKKGQNTVTERTTP